MEEEIWKDIIIEKNGVLYDYTGIYQVSNLGRIRSLDRITPDGRNIKGQVKAVKINRDGYVMVELYKNRKGVRHLVHRIVATAFIKNDNPVNKTEVNHIDLNRKNNVVTNLEWISHTDNVKYSYKQGSHKGRQIGEKNNKARLTEEQVIDTRRKYDSGEMTQMELAKEYNVGWSTIHNIVFRLTWKHI